MTKKEYIPTKRVFETIYEKHSGQDKNRSSMSVTISVEYIWNRPNAVEVLFNDCGEDCMEYFGDYDVEYYIFIKGEAAQKLANKFSAHDEKTLLKRMADRFRHYGLDTRRKMEAWLEQKGIEYTTSIY